MDARIPMMGRPLDTDVVGQLRKGEELNALRRQADVENRALARQDMLNEAWKQSGGDANKLRALLIEGGQGSMVPELEKSFAEVQKTQGMATKSSSEGLLKRMDASRRLLDGVNDPRAFARWQLSNLNDPVIGEFYRQHGIDENQIIQEVQDAMQSPDGFQRLLTESKMDFDKIMENTYQQQNLGDRSVIKALPKYGTGPATVVSEEAIGKNPNVSPAARGEMSEYQKEKLRLEQGRLDVSKKEQERKQSTMVDLPPKVRQAREAAFPKATLAVKDFTTKSDNLIKDLEALRDSGGLSGMTGLVFGRTPNARPESRKARALFDKIIARGSFQELANMRASSPTGGALGQVSDFENKKLERVFGGLDTTLDTKDFREAIDQVIDEIKSSQARTQEAYDMDYEYRQESGEPAATGSDEGWTDL